MRIIDENKFAAIIHLAETVEADGHGIKVYRLRDGTYFKLFRVKRLLTSARFVPYSVRFASNGVKLRALGIPTVDVIDLYSIPHLHRTAVHYQPLAGETLRDMPDQQVKALISNLGTFLAELHDKGIFFRSVHFGNIVLTADKRLGLIDIGDMRFSGRPLTKFSRARNFKHLCRYRNDRQLIASELESFVRAYSGNTDISADRARSMIMGAAAG